MSTAYLLYLYGVVPTAAAEPPPELLGVEVQPVARVSAGSLSGIISRVPADLYSEASLEARLADLPWVGERGVAHDRVLTWFADRGPVVPLSPFSLHEDESRVRERLLAAGPTFERALRRVAGRQEWVVKLWREEARFAAERETASPRLQALRREMDAAGPGRRYLLATKYEAARTDEFRQASSETARRVFESLREAAEAAARLPVAGERAGAERQLVLNAAFLVPVARFATFQDRVSELSAQTRPGGFDWEFTGPWPAYHFVES